MLDFETSNSKLEVSKSNSWKITYLSKTTSLQRELFLAMFYTINLSPALLVIKKGFMMIIVLSNNQYCPRPLTTERAYGIMPKKNGLMFRLYRVFLQVEGYDNTIKHNTHMNRY